jgi:hypothetical protein
VFYVTTRTHQRVYGTRAAALNAAARVRGFVRVEELILDSDGNPWSLAPIWGRG